MFFKEVDKFTERNEESADFLRKRLWVAAAIIFFFFTLIMLRLWSLQIYHGEEYKRKADSNRMRRQEIAAPRGHILDRYGREIVSNRPSFNVVMIREDSDDTDEVLKRLAPILHEDISTLWQRIRDAERTPRYMPVVLKRDVDWETLAYLENHNQMFSGIRIDVQPVRVYNYGDLAAHIVGYLGSINRKELQKADRSIYKGGDIIGRAGLERLREKDLRGEKGQLYTEVNAQGFEQRQLKYIAPLPGKEIHLTLDVELQKVAEALMNAEDKTGAAVVMEVKTGRLLALVSAPSIHLDDFVGGISSEKWRALNSNPKIPLLNRVVQGAYPPGSTYKMITALAGLAAGKIDEHTEVYCPGYYNLGKTRFRCWKKSGHGSVNLKQALARSCDVYFYQLGQWIGPDAIAEMAGKFGLGQRTGVELEGEKRGLIPTKAWKRKRYNTKWHEGETLNIAIGQGTNLVTPLQLCQMTATLANYGRRMKPQIVEKVVAPGGNIVEEFTPEVVSETNINPRHLRMVWEGMVEVVHGKHGTARNHVRIDGLTVAGKTGTVQVVSGKRYQGLKEEDIPYKYRSHGWFTCFAPAEDPEIAVTVLIEHGLHGGSVAGPVAKKILEKYFEDRLKKVAQTGNHSSE